MDVAPDFARNTDYTPALELLLERLGALGARLVDATVDSQMARRLGLSWDARRLELLRHAYPLELSGVSDFGQLRLDNSAAQGRAAKSPKARKAGNYTNRIRLVPICRALRTTR